MVHCNRRCNTKIYCFPEWVLEPAERSFKVFSYAWQVEKLSGKKKKLLYSDWFWYYTNESISCLSQPSLRLGGFFSLLFIHWQLIYFLIYFLRAQEWWHISKYVKEQIYSPDIYSCKARAALHSVIQLPFHHYLCIYRSWKSFIKLAPVRQIQTPFYLQ